MSLPNFVQIDVADTAVEQIRCASARLENADQQPMPMPLSSSDFEARCISLRHELVSQASRRDRHSSDSSVVCQAAADLNVCRGQARCPALQARRSCIERSDKEEAFVDFERAGDAEADHRRRRTPNSSSSKFWLYNRLTESCNQTPCAPEAENARSVVKSTERNMSFSSYAQVNKMCSRGTEAKRFHTGDKCTGSRKAMQCTY